MLPARSDEMMLIPLVGREKNPQEAYEGAMR
jgi:hypothetical protein